MGSPEASTSTLRLDSAKEATPTAAAAAAAAVSSSIHVKPFDDSADQASTTTTSKEKDDRLSDDDDDDLDDLDDDLLLGGVRERRLEELKSQMSQLQKLKQSEYGQYNEYKDEKKLIEITAKAERSLVHFFHSDFKRCKIMDQHLYRLAPKHQDTLFIKIDVANSPFLVHKMDIKVLPCVVGFVKGISKLKIVGFEELPGGDDFKTSALEFGLIQSNVIKDPNQPKVFPTGSMKRDDGHSRRGIRSSGTNREEDDDSDLDY